MIVTILNISGCPSVDQAQENIRDANQATDREDVVVRH